MTITKRTTEENYPQALDVLTNIASALMTVASQTVDIPEMRTICAKYEALAPVLEPTAYQRGGAMNLHDQSAFLAAVDRFVTDLKKLDRSPADVQAQARTTEESR